MLDKIIQVLKNRLGEPSTGRAITVVVGYVSYRYFPEHAETIAEVTVVLLAMFGFAPDKKKTAAEIAAEKEAEIEAKLAESREFIMLNTPKTEPVVGKV